jgi:hypothetical protein
MLKNLRPGRVFTDKTYASGIVRNREHKTPPTNIFRLFQKAIRKPLLPRRALYAETDHCQGGRNIPSRLLPIHVFDRKERVMVLHMGIATTTNINIRNISTMR